LPDWTPEERRRLWKELRQRRRQRRRRRRAIADARPRGVRIAAEFRCTAICLNGHQCANPRMEGDWDVCYQHTEQNQTGNSTS
jgi:hypothetical protein